MEPLSEWDRLLGAYGELTPLETMRRLEKSEREVEALKVELSERSIDLDWEEQERNALAATVETLRAALDEAADALFRAGNMLSAINHGDPSEDRRKASVDAQQAQAAARRVLASLPERSK